MAPPQKAAFSFGDLPVEIFLRILEFTVVDSVPIVDPIGNSESCLCESQRSHACVQKHGEAAQRRTGKNALVDSAIREGDGIDREERITRAGICPNILLVNKAFNEIGTKLLYESNRFMFTNHKAVYCFADRYPLAAEKIRHVEVPIQIRQWTADHKCHMARLGQAQVYPDGPWYSEAIDPCTWWDQYGDTWECPFPWLETLEIRLVDWQQMEAVNANGNPHVIGPVHYGADGKPYTINPATADLKLDTHVSQPFRIVQGFNAKRRLKNMVTSDWVAERIKVTGCENAQNHRKLQREVSKLSNAHPKMKMIKAVPKRDRTQDMKMLMMKRVMWWAPDDDNRDGHDDF